MPWSPGAVQTRRLSWAGAAGVTVVTNSGCGDADGAGAMLTGIYFNATKYARWLICTIFGDGTAAHDVGIKLYQAKTAAGGDAKVLDALSTGRIFSKKGASFALLQAVTAWTKETQATPDEAWVDLTSGESVGVIACEVKASDLDGAGGFKFIRADLDDPTAAKVVDLFAIGLDPVYAAGPESMADPLT